MRKVLALMFMLTFLLFLTTAVSGTDIKEFALKNNRLLLRDGDANNDGRVNIFDLAQVGHDYGKSSEDPDWNWKTDVANTVDRINIFDLAEVGQKYGNNYLQEIEDPVFISPAVSNVSENKEFPIDVNISTPAQVYAVDFVLNFNPDLIEIVNVSESNFLSGDGTSTYTIIDYNNSEGRLEYASTRLGSTEGVNGSGSLASIKFKAKNVGQGTISFESLELVDPNLNEISNVSTINGTVNIDAAGLPPFVSGYDIDNQFFSPNGDGRKDNVTISVNASELVQWEMEIMKGETSCKWGWSTSNYQKNFERTWDGTCNFDSEPIERDFSVIVRMEDRDGRVSEEYLPNLTIDLTLANITNVTREPKPTYNDDNVSLSALISDPYLEETWLVGDWEGMVKNYSLNSNYTLNSHTYVVNSTHLQKATII